MISSSSELNQKSSWHEVVPDLTPMLDMLFILLVFFMLTVGTVYKSLDLVLPSGVTEELPHEELNNKIVLEISAKEYALRGEAIADMDQLKDQITKLMLEEKNPEVVIASDKNVSIEKLLNILTYLQSQGIEAANILMNQKE